MKKNIGALDSGIRIDLAFVSAYVYFAQEDPTLWYTIGLLFAGHLLATAVFGTDPLYKLLKISSDRGDGQCGSCRE
ncbi:MAG: hypothetical protein ACJAV6_000623 [Candidatus Paceibacteria bacterium]|jgi:hypothetical protein